MKKKLIFAAVIVALVALALVRYTLIEVNAPLPEDVKSGSAAQTGQLVSSITKAPAQTPTPEPTPEPTPKPVMQSGSSGEDVKTLQTRLREYGFMTGGADGQYGAKTKAGVQKLQAYLDELNRQEQAVLSAQLSDEAQPDEDAGSPAAAPDDSGSADDNTHNDNDDTKETAPQDTRKPAEDTPAYSGAVDQALWDFLNEGGFSVYRETVSNGSKGLETERVQTRLIALGYLGGAADGDAGGRTVSAIRSFQSSNGLGADGVAGEKTQRLLFSGGAKRYVKPARPYMLKIDTSKQRVYAYSYDKATGGYSNLVRTMVCSTGKDATPTPKGTFTSTSPVARWGYFPKYDVWGQYLYRINGSILFHSVLYTDSNENSLIAGSLYKLGTKASHGCVRLSVEDAKWIYTNCSAGTTVKVV